MEKLPRLPGPAPRRDSVIDPKWPHDQAMATDHDWPHDSAMILPHADDGEEEIPLLGELPGLVERNLPGDPEAGGWGDVQFGEEFGGTAE